MRFCSISGGIKQQNALNCANIANAAEAQAQRPAPDPLEISFEGGAHETAICNESRSAIPAARALAPRAT